MVKSPELLVHWKCTPFFNFFYLKIILIVKKITHRIGRVLRFSFRSVLQFET